MNLRLRKGDLGGMKLWGLCELWLDRGGVVEVEMVSLGGEERTGAEEEGSGEDNDDMAAFLVLCRRKRWKSGIIVGRESLAGRPQRQPWTAAERKGGR